MLCLYFRIYRSGGKIISEIGTIIKNRYCLIEQIGQGGQGSLYLARDMELGILRVIKKMPMEQKKEAEYMRRLDYPSLPGMVDYAEQSGSCYLVMEYIRGKTLQQCLNEGIVFSVKELFDFGMTITEVLSYLHTRNPPIYYGDLKPDNLMLSENEKLYLIDLGSAVNGYEDRVQVLCGTDGFAAPEQYQGRICASSDIYGLGKTLEVLGGGKKWRYFFLRPDFVLFLLRCCRKDPRHRYQDMEAVRRRLEILSGKKKRKKLVWVFLLLGTVAGYVSFSLSPAGKICFDDALSRTTEGYYSSVFLEGDAEDRKQVCEDMEDRLQKLLENYREKECQRRLLLLLAANSELMERPDRAAVYYEQLLLYDPEFGEGYTEYGLFLCRQNRKEAARKLWKRYQQMLGESDAEPGHATKVRLWQKEVEESDEKEKEKPDV